MEALLSTLLKAENALARSLPSKHSEEALQVHIDALWAVQDIIRKLSQPN